MFERSLDFVSSACRVIIFSTMLFLNSSQGQQAGHIVISEIYGGGGNTGALYTHDFIELYNPTGADLSITNWSIQYQTAGGSGPFSAVAVFSGLIPSNGFFLIQANPGSGGTQALPTPDAIAPFSLAASSGKVALSSDTLPVSGPSDTTVVDFVGFGSANLYEGSGPATGAGNTSSIERKAAPGSDDSTMGPGGAEELHGNGHDSDDNAEDFFGRSEPEPQNSSAGPEHAGGDLKISVSYDPKWNMVSIPLDVPEGGDSALFPHALTPLYSYSEGYLPEASATNGKGYWIKFDAADSVHFNGFPGAVDSIILDTGWNLIGPGAVPVDVPAIIEHPAGHVVSGFYGYEAGYVDAGVLEPGRGYWVRSTGGTIILDGGATLIQSGSRLSFPRSGSSSGEYPPPPPFREAVEEGEFPPGGKGQIRDKLRIRSIAPNPFNPRTIIEIEMEEAAEIEVSIIDLAGRRVARLFSDLLGVGVHKIPWDISTSTGRRVSSGVYLIRVSGLGRVHFGRVLLMK